MAVVLLGWHAHMITPSYAASASPAAKPAVIQAWTHEDVDSRQFRVLLKSAETFNRRQHAYRVEIVPSLRRDYINWIQREAATGSLPCLLELDGPYLAMFAWPGYLQPIDKFVPRSMLNDFLPSIVAQGTYQGRLYSLGQYESGLGLWGNRRHLEAARVRISTVNAPWTLAEFEQALERLTALDDVDYAINFAMYARDEFYSYGYSPILQGFGGDVIDRRTYRTASGVLDGPQSVAAMQHFRRWLDKGWTRAVLDHHNDFDKGRAALSWTGHWAYPPYLKALGKDLLLMPLPDFGRGIKTGMGSWTWGISSTCHSPAGAWAFLAHLLSPDEMLSMTGVNGAMPARYSALAQSPLYKPGGALHLYAEQLKVGGVPRPQTPAYGMLSRTFATSVSNIIAGGDVQSELSNAAANIDHHISAHRGYPYP